MIARLARRSDRRRGATTLIEVVAAMAVSAVLFTMSATMMVLLFRLERLGRDELTATITEGRLAADLRADVRSATDLELEPGAPGGSMRLLGPDRRTVTYLAEDGDLIRRRRSGEGPDHIERYRLLPGTISRWELAASGPWRRVVLELDAPKIPRTVEGGRRVLRIEATLGRDHRFEGDEP
jgi:hypothetical protein